MILLHVRLIRHEPIAVGPLYQNDCYEFEKKTVIEIFWVLKLKKLPNSFEKN
jgi:hypothetical protein